MARAGKTRKSRASDGGERWDGRLAWSRLRRWLLTALYWTFVLMNFIGLNANWTATFLPSQYP